MPSISEKDRVSLCRYSFSDHRRCRTPRSPSHPHFCFNHARQESQSRATSELAADIAYFFSAEYISANDLNAALARLFPAIIRGDIKPRMAKTLVYLAQVFSQTISIAQQEYLNAYGGDYWRRTIRTSISQNSKRDDPPSPISEPSIDNPTASDEPTPVASVENSPIQSALDEPTLAPQSHDAAAVDESVLGGPSETDSANSPTSSREACHPERSQGSQPPLAPPKLTTHLQAHQPQPV